MSDEADGGDTPGDATADSGPDLEPSAWWDELLADAGELAAEYEADGWDALELHPGDVTPLDGEFDDRVGLSVLVPDNEYDRLESALAEADVERYDAYRRAVGGCVALLLTVETTDDTAIVCPAYYERDAPAVDAMFEQARDEGTLRVYLRRLDQTSVVLSLDDPELLAPEA